MTRYRVLLVMALSLFPLHGPLLAQVSDTNTITETGRLSPLEAGKALFDQEKFADATRRLRQAVREEKQSAAAHYWLGRTYLQMDHRRLDARNELRTAARLAPDDAEIQYYLGMSFMTPGKVDQIVGGERDGRFNFLKAVELDPTHPDAYYQLGRCHETAPVPEFENAINAYIMQFKVRPDHPEALRGFLNACHLSERYGLGADLLGWIVEELGDATPAIVHPLLSQFRDLSDVSDRKYGPLLEALETYISLLDHDEQAQFRDLDHVAPPDEKRAWESASAAERDALWQTFWNVRDSNPSTVENERLMEHYRRVLYARHHFSEGQKPYDRRGEIYVRYGVPDNRRDYLYTSDQNTYDEVRISDDATVDAIREQNQQFGYQLRVDRGDLTILLPEDVAQRVGFGAQSQMAAEEAVGGLVVDGLVVSAVDIAWQRARKEMGTGYATESWVYVDYGLELHFVDQFGGGRFDYPWPNLLSSLEAMVRQERFSPRRLATELIKRRPEEYLHDFGGEPLEYAFDAVTFRTDNGATELDLSYTIPVWQFGDVSDGKGTSTMLEHHVTLRDSTMSPNFTHEFGFGPFDRPERKLEEGQVNVPVYTLPASVEAPSGHFTLAVQVRDETSGRIGVYRKPVTLADYSGDELLISDLKLATSVRPSSVQGPFVRNRLNITPNPGRLYVRGRPVYVYYEIYNLGLDQDRKSSYEINYEITPADREEPLAWSARRQEDMQTVMMTFAGEGYSAEDREYTALDTSDLPAGEYVLSVTLKDQHSGQTVSKSANFLVMER